MPAQREPQVLPVLPVLLGQLARQVLKDRLVPQDPPGLMGLTEPRVLPDQSVLQETLVQRVQLVQ